MLDLGLEYERFAQRLWRYTYAKTRNAADADDICGTVWLQACEIAPRWEDRGWPFSAWLYRVAQARIVDRARAWSRHPLLPLEEAGALAYDAPGVGHLDAREEAPGVLSRMTPPQRRACWLRYGAELSNSEVGALMGLSPGAVKALTVRGRASVC